MPLACMICIARRGIRGSNPGDFFKDQEELNEHIEGVHHMPIIRPGETKEECLKRFLEKYPEAKTCPECIAAGALWTREN